MSVMCSTHHQQKQRPPYDPFASALCSLAKADPTLLGVKRGSAPAAIGMLLSASSADETNALLSAVEASAEHSEKWCPYAAAVLRGALVEVQCSSESKIAGRAAALLGKIKCVGGCACRETSDSKYPKNPLLITVETMHRELCQTWSKEDAKEVHSWLFEQDFGVNEGNCDDNGSITSEEEEEKESANNSNCADGDPLFTLFFRPFLMHPAVSVREEAMEVAVRRRGTDVLPLLTAVLHMLQEEEENSTRTRTAAPGELTLKAISTIAHFARCKAAVTPVLSALVPLTKRPALFPTALRALELVWELQPRTAPVLFSRLQQYRPEMSGDMRLAIALTVRDVALEDPAAAASDLVHVILAIVRSDPSSVCVGLALEALCYVGDVIDFASIDTFVRTRGLLEKSAPRVVAAAVRLLGSAAARKALAGSQLPSGEAMELPEEDAAVVRAVVAKLAPLREHSDGLVRAAVFDVLGQFPTEFTMEFLEFGIATAICADSCAAARDAGLSLLAKLGAAESSFRGAVASTPSSSSTASRPKTSPKKVGGSDAKARKALEALPGVVAGEWAEDSRTGSSRSALYGALLWAGQGGAGEASQGEGLWDAVDEALEAFECGRGWESRILALSALSTFARKASPALITDSDAAGRLLSTLEDRATESPARGEVCALLAGVFAAALPLTARPHAATFAQAARRWLSEESPEAQFLCGCRVAVACCEGVLLGGSDFATAASALVEEYSGLVIDEDGDEWDRGGAAIGLALISFFVAEAASHRSGSEGVAALLPAYNSLHTLLVDEYDEVEWWRWLGAVALSSVALALLALGDAAPAQTLFSESLTAAKECSGGVCSNAWHSVSCIVLSRTCAGLYNAKKIDGEKRSEALRAMLKAVTAMDNNNNYTDSDVDDTVKGGWLIALAALANFAAGGKSNSSSSSSTTTNGTSAVDDTLTLLKDLVVDADSLPSQAFCLDVFVACANVLGAGVIAGGGSTGPWPLADGALTNNFTRCKALEEAAPGLVQTFRDSFEGDEVGVSKAATWAIGALCRPLPQAPVEDSDSGTGSNSSSSNNKPVHSAVTDAAPSSSAFAGMPVAKLVYETLVDGAGREDFATVATALDYLSSTQRLPNIKWDKLLNVNINKIHIKSYFHCFYRPSTKASTTKR